MPKRTVTIVVCDHCRSEIPGTPGATYLDASYYGPVICEPCFTKMTATDLAQFLDLDEIRRRTLEGDECVGRAWESPR